MFLIVSMFPWTSQLSPGRGWQRRAEEDLEEESDGEGALVPLLGPKPLGGWAGQQLGKNEI